MAEKDQAAQGRLVAVTGANGHVGANLVRLLLERGYRVRALVHRHREALQDLPLELVQADILEGDKLVEALRGAEIVFHLAALISILEADLPRMEQINVTGTRNVVAACRRAGVRRLVMASSIEALLQAGAENVSEDAPVEEGRLLSAYSLTKHRATKEALAARGSGLEVVVVYPTAVVGPWDFRPSLLGHAILDFGHRRLPCLVPGGFDFVDARDVAWGMLAAAEKGRDGEGYLLSGEYLSLAQMAEVLEQASGARRPRIVLPLWLARLFASLAVPFYRLLRRPARFTPQSVRLLSECKPVPRGKAERELDYHPRPAAQAFQDAVDWYRQNDRLKRVFFSSRDPLPVIMVLLFLLAGLLGGLFGVFSGRPERWLGLAAAAAALAYLLISFPVRYEVGRRELLVRAGLAAWRIPLESIVAVETSRLPVGAPAWSWNRLKIVYRNKKGRSDFLLISPAERAAFLSCLPESARRQLG